MQPVLSHIRISRAVIDVVKLRGPPKCPFVNTNYASIHNQTCSLE